MSTTVNTDPTVSQRVASSYSLGGVGKEDVKVFIPLNINPLPLKFNDLVSGLPENLDFSSFSLTDTSSSKASSENPASPFNRAYFESKGVNFDAIENCSISEDPGKVRCNPCFHRSAAQKLPENIKELVGFLSAYDMTFQKIGADFQRHGNIPKLFNYIWVGSELTRPDFRKNIEEWRSLYPDHEFVIWSDVDHLTSEYKSLCVINRLRVINIYEALPDGAWFGVKDAFLLQLTKINPNYGEASDLLRYVILYHFGGIYLDSDAPTNYLDHDKFKQSSPEGLLLDQRCNDMFITEARNSYFRDLLVEALKRYHMPKPALIQKYGDVRPEAILETVIRTGPQLLGEVREKGSHRIHDIPRGTGFHLLNAGSWLFKKIKPLSPPVTADDINRIKSEILWDVKNNNIHLDLAKFQRWVGEQNHQLIIDIYQELKSKYESAFSGVKDVCVVDMVNFHQLATAKDQLGMHLRFYSFQSALRSKALDIINFLGLFLDFQQYNKFFPGDPALRDLLCYLSEEEFDNFIRTLPCNGKTLCNRSWDFYPFAVQYKNTDVTFGINDVRMSVKINPGERSDKLYQDYIEGILAEKKPVLSHPDLVSLFKGKLWFNQLSSKCKAEGLDLDQEEELVLSGNGFKMATKPFFTRLKEEYDKQNQSN